MATLGDLRTQIADELQIDGTTFSTEIDRAIFSAINFYKKKDFWFLDATPTTFLITATSQYSMASILPGRGRINDIQLQISPGNTLMHYVTLGEFLSEDFDDNFTGEPYQWAINGDTLLVLPRAQRTYTAVAWYSLQATTTASASADTVWTNEAMDMIRCKAKAHILLNRMKDFTEASVQETQAQMYADQLDEDTVIMRASRKIKPWL